jgi:formate C-acetyltransferase
MGYAPEDAVNYVVAACWEFIIPGVGDDIANVCGLNLPLAVDRVIRRSREEDGFDALLDGIRRELREECDRIAARVQNIYFIPSPFMDLLRRGRKYQNFGVHGCGVSSAADALAAVKKHVFEDKTLTLSRLVAAMDENFASEPALLHRLRYESPKMGCEGGERAAEMSKLLLSAFSDALAGRTNCLGGRWRAGTGTAMFYLWHAAEMGATADGRLAGEPFGTNFSPTLFARTEGPVTVIDHFTAADMQKTLNGGPLTLEFASSMFAEEDSIRKLAMLIKYFISRRGHQLQLNAVNPDRMREAQRNPDAYRQLVVRIWGWSAYFVELDKPFQDHVIARQEYTL